MAAIPIKVATKIQTLNILLQNYENGKMEHNFDLFFVFPESALALNYLLDIR